MRRDSISIEEEIILDEDGNPVERQHPTKFPSNEEKSEPAATHKKAKEEAVNFDNL